MDRTSHYLAVPDESRGQQAFGEGISHHFVRAKRHEFEEAIQYEFTHIILMNVNMTGELLVVPQKTLPILVLMKALQ